MVLFFVCFGHKRGWCVFEELQGGESLVLTVENLEALAAYRRVLENEIAVDTP